MADIERVEVMAMRSRLHWLGHLDRLDDTDLPKCLLVCCPLGGKCSVGDWRIKWCDVIMRDMKKCDLTPDQCDAACKRAVWWEFVEDGTSELNVFLKEDEEKEKYELKLEREGNGPSLQSQSSTICRQITCWTIQSRSGEPNQAETWCRQHPCPHC